MDPQIVGIELALSAMIVALLVDDAYLIRAIGRAIRRLYRRVRRWLAPDAIGGRPGRGPVSAFPPRE